MTDWEGREKGSVSQSQPVLASNGQPEAEPSALTALLARVEEASGADRALDCDLAIAAGFWTPPRGSQRDATYPDVWRRGGLKYYCPHTPATASLDAALAFCEQALPGWTVASISEQDDKTWFAELREGYLTSYGRVAISTVAHGKRPKIPALALIAAMLRALIAVAGERSEPQSPRQVERADSRDTKKSIPKSAGKESAP